jgi:predicted N-acetyltransferase YhbS
MDITIRQISPTEYAALGEITAQAYLADGLLDFGENDEYLGELRDVAKRATAAEVLAAVEKGSVLGGVTFVPAGGPMADIAGPGEAEIRMPAVAHEACGRGIGEALVRACLERARTVEGCVRLVLSTQRSMTRPTGSTTAWASPAHRSATGTPFPTSTTSRSSPMN